VEAVRQHIRLAHCELAFDDVLLLQCIELTELSAWLSILHLSMVFFYYYVIKLTSFTAAVTQ